MTLAPGNDDLVWVRRCGYGVEIATTLAAGNDDLVWVRRCGYGVEIATTQASRNNNLRRGIAGGSRLPRCARKDG